MKIRLYCIEGIPLITRFKTSKPSLSEPSSSSIEGIPLITRFKTWKKSQSYDKDVVTY